ncbi:conserved hypothetical protein, secreted [mine drainage metagenome]|uniref:Uncharacterized protein n=1 Tax=mine drainage metagenome TaxID=410659 RepID=T1A5N8_9ZZZZ
MDKRLFTLVGALMLLALGVPQSHAGLVNDIPSCYAASHFTFSSPPPDRLLYVLIDQATPLSPALQKSVVDNINHALGPATKFVIAEFSRTSNNHYLQVLHTGIIESPMTSSERNNVPVNALGGFDNCMRDQAFFAIHMADTSAQQILQSATGAPNQPNDILLALKTVAPVIAQDPARQKVLFLVSNGFENSSFAHFASGTFNPEQMLQQARAKGLLANFGGAQVFVLGAGITP